jgi:hypothetical protein
VSLKIAKPTGAALRLAKPTGASVRLKATWAPADPDAAAYITAVEAADGQALEQPVALAIDNFVLGCKANGIWSAIKASCILAGARTLAGALVPLVGAAPTNFNFVSGDYNRKTGLVGDASTKYLNSGRNNNADPQNSKHTAVYVSTAASNVGYFFGDSESSGCILLARLSATQYRARVASSTNSDINPGGEATGLLGVSRADSSSFGIRANGTTTNVTNASVAPTSTSIQLFRSGGLPINARLAFYSIGESLNLTLLDARVTALVAAFAAAIP